MEKEQYIKERLDDQIDWYNKKSMSHQNIYKWWKGIQITLSATIPFIAGYIDSLYYLAIITGIMGVVITCIEGILTLGKHHENWIEYRSICETLKHEKYMYLTNTGIYQNESAFSMLVERVESIISQENVNWAALNYDQNKKLGGNKNG